MPFALLVDAFCFLLLFYYIVIILQLMGAKIWDVKEVGLRAYIPFAYWFRPPRKIQKPQTKTNTNKNKLKDEQI